MTENEHQEASQQIAAAMQDVGRQLALRPDAPIAVYVNKEERERQRIFKRLVQTTVGIGASAGVLVCLFKWCSHLLYGFRPSLNAWYVSGMIAGGLGFYGLLILIPVTFLWSLVASIQSKNGLWFLAGLALIVLQFLLFLMMACLNMLV